MKEPHISHNDPLQQPETLGLGITTVFPPELERKTSPGVWSRRVSPTGRHHSLYIPPSLLRVPQRLQTSGDKGWQQESWRRTLSLPPFPPCERRGVTLISHEEDAESSTSKAEGVVYVDGEKRRVQTWLPESAR